MNIEEFREYCLSFKGVHEKMPFPNVPDQYSRDVLCFYVADKWFCFVNIEIFDFCCIKCNPDESGELQTEYAGIKPGWHMNKKYWISVYFNQDVSDDKIKELVSKSYDAFRSFISNILSIVFIFSSDVLCWGMFYIFHSVHYSIALPDKDFFAVYR